jgi:hypothetical protein
MRKSGDVGCTAPVVETALEPYCTRAQYMLKLDGTFLKGHLERRCWLDFYRSLKCADAAASLSGESRSH